MASKSVVRCTRCAEWIGEEHASFEQTGAQEFKIECKKCGGSFHASLSDFRVRPDSDRNPFKPLLIIPT